MARKTVSMANGIEDVEKKENEIKTDRANHMDVNGNAEEENKEVNESVSTETDNNATDTQAPAENKPEENKPIDTSKNKMISAKVNEGMYKKFSDICDKKGISKNSKINELIADFVIENENIL